MHGILFAGQQSLALGADPFGFDALPAPSGPSAGQGIAAKPAGGAVVQALNPKMVPKTSNAKKDPFADLFS